MKKKPSTIQYYLNLILALFSLQQLSATDTTSYHSKYVIGGTTALAALAYASYLYTQHPNIAIIPNAENSSIKAIIFDIDGVLSATNKLRAFQEVGIGSTLWPIARDFQVPSEKLLFDTLADVPALSTYTSYNKGLRMPQIMIDWQTNAQTIPAIQAAVTAHLTTSSEPESVKNWTLQTVMMMTDPARLVATRQLLSENIKLVHELKDKGYKLYILSNWDKASFPLFQSTFPELFQHNGTDTFDGIMISGDVGIVKPEINIFKKCLKTFNLQAQSCVFIDDESANINAAQKMGVHTLHANPHDPQAVRNQLITQLNN